MKNGKKAMGQNWTGLMALSPRKKQTHQERLQDTKGEVGIRNFKGM